MPNSFDFHPVINALKERESRFDLWRSIVPAVIKTEGGVVSPPNQPNKVWVAENNSPNSKVLAWNPHGFSVPETPVLIGRSPRPPYERIILGINMAVFFQNPSETQVTLIATGPHGQNHQVPSDANPGLDPVYIFMAALMPFKTTADGESLVVGVQPFTYRVGPTTILFPGQQVDLTDYLPSVGNIRYVLLYLDEETNDIVVEPGEEVLDNGAIDVPYPDIPDGGRPTSFVPLTGAQVAVQQSSVEDARELFPRPVSVAESGTDIPDPDEDGQVLYSDGGTWSWRTPVTTLADGWIVDNDGKLVVV